MGETACTDCGCDRATCPQCMSCTICCCCDPDDGCDYSDSDPYDSIEEYEYYNGKSLPIEDKDPEY